MISCRTVLHVGCGSTPLPAWLDGSAETRLDIDATYNPDFIADMRSFDVGKYDVVYSSHALEHLYPHDVVPTLQNFRNALNEGGVVIVIVPNLEGIQATDDVVYFSASGPITGLDMIYGCRKYLKDAPAMAHHTGFTRKTLQRDMEAAGFERTHVMADGNFNLIGVGR